MNTTTLDDPHFDLRILATNDWEKDVRARSYTKEPETFSWIQRFRPGEVVYDVGANVGGYSLPLAARGVDVVAFEPSPWTYAHLVENVRLNGLEHRVLPICCLLGFITGIAPIELSDPSAGAASHQVGKGKLTLPLWSLDDVAQSLMLPTPAGIKIDVDGMEVDVLRGGRIALSLARSVLVETTPDTAKDVDGILQSLGFGMAEFHPHLHSGVTNSVFTRNG